MTRVWFGLFGLALGILAAVAGYLLARRANRRFERAFYAANEPMRRCLRETEEEFKELIGEASRKGTPPRRQSR